jgi:hypothetical protein
MSVTKIQGEVRRLPAQERKKLTAWMVAEYPVLTVERLMAKAARRVKAEAWSPAPPTSDNFPRGRTLAHALRVADRLGLGK